MSALSISIGADTSDLNAKLALAQANVRNFNKEVRDLADQMQGASEEAQASLLPQLQAAATASAEAKAQVAGLKAEIAELAPATEQAGGVMVRMSESVEGLNARLIETRSLASGLGELFAVGLGGEKLLELAKNSVELGDSLRKASLETGISIQTLSALKGSADYADLGFDQLQRGLSKFATSLESAQSGTGKTAEILRVLRISQQEIVDHGNDAAYMLERVAKALDNYGDGFGKEAAISELFGMRQRDLAIVLKDLAENGLKGVTDRAREQGILFGGEFVDQADRGKNELVEFGHTLDALKADAIALLPVIEAVGHTLELILGGDAERAKVHLGGVNRAIEETEAKITALQAQIAAGSPGSLHFIDEMELKREERELDELKKKADEYRARMKADEKDDAPKSQEQAPKPQMPAVGQDAEAEKYKQAAYTAEIARMNALTQQYAANSAQRTEILRQELALATVDWGAESTQAIEAQGRLNAAIREAMEHGATSSQGMIDKMQELSNWATHMGNELELSDARIIASGRRAEAELDDRFAKFRKLNDELTKNTEKTSEEVAQIQIKSDQQIARSGAQTITGLITGRQTLLQAVQGYAEKGLEKVIEYGLQELIEHTGIETAKTAATAAGEQAQVAAKVAGAAEGRAVDAAAGSATVMGDAHKAAAGAYSAVAGIPLVGPVLAPIAAGVAFGAVAAFDVFSAEGGWMVPQDTLAMVHENERILPARYSAGLDAMVGAAAQGSGTGGGDTYHIAPVINYQGLIDARGLKNLEMAIPAAIAKAARGGNFNKLLAGP